MEDIFSKMCKECTPNGIKNIKNWITLIPGISYYPILFKNWSCFSAFEISYAENSSKKYNLYLVCCFGGDYSKVKLFKSSLDKCQQGACSILKIMLRLDIYSVENANSHNTFNSSSESQEIYCSKSLEEEMSTPEIYANAIKATNNN